MRITRIISLITGLCLSISVYAISDQTLQKTLFVFQQYAKKSMALTKTPGMAIAIVKGDKIIFAKGFGVRKLGSKSKINSHTIFQIGSISKSFTTALMAILIDNGKAHWDDRVIDYFLKFKMYDPWVTQEYRIVDLPAQYSGLKPHEGDYQVMVGFNRVDIIKNLRYFKPISSFRSKFAYQNTLLLVEAAIEQKITGKTWEQLLHEDIFKPLGMNETSTTLHGYLTARNVAWLHNKIEGKIEPIEKNRPYFDWVYTYGPAGSINSNIIDMSKWLILQMNSGKFRNKQIISAKNVAFMQRPRVFVDIPFYNKLLTTNSYYGLSWMYSEYSPDPIIWHNGGTAGAHSVLAFIPQLHIGIVVLTNSAGNGALAESLAFTFFDMYFGKPQRHLVEKSWRMQYKLEKKEQTSKRPLNPQPPLQLNNYTGIYHNPIYGNAKIFLQKNHLVLKLNTKKPITMNLYHWDRDIFSLKYPNLGGGYSKSKVLFSLDKNGNVNKLTIVFLEKDSDGVFYRKPEFNS